MSRVMLIVHCLASDVFVMASMTAWELTGGQMLGMTVG